MSGLKLRRGVAWLAAFGLSGMAGGIAALGSVARSDAGVTVASEARAASSSLTAFEVSVEGRTFTASLPSDSVATYEWTPDGGSVNWWQTTSAGKRLGPKPGQAQQAISFGAPTSSLPSLSVEPSAEHQTIAGFGGAMTESAAYVIDKSPDKSEIISKLFGSEDTSGHEDAHFNIVRVPVGASDFNVTKATSSSGSYEETPGQFTIKSAEAYSVPALEAAKRTEPELQIIAAPWSAPGWMKLSKQFVPKKCTSTSDQLQTADYELYAHYLALAAKAYAAKHLPFKIISLENEPQAPCSKKYPTMELTPSDEATLSTLLHIELHGLADPPQILGWDHNWDEEAKVKAAKATCASLGPEEVRASFPQEIFEDPNDVEDIGYHSYCGWPYEPSGLPDLKLEGNANGGPGIYVTESTGTGKNETNASGNLVYEVQHEIMDPIRDGAKASIYWNLALESKDGPENGNCSHKCRPMVSVPTAGAPIYNEDYYYWSQFSRHIQPGAVRIGSTPDAEAALDTVAFKNPNGSIVLVVLNGAHMPTESLENATAVTTGDNSCALVSAGSVDCWGDNEFGELGSGLNPGNETQACNGTGSSCSLTPVAVGGITGAIDVSSGDSGTVCALLSAGSVDCWGRASEGELGDGTNIGPDSCAGTEACSTTPVHVIGITRATEIATGSQHACALISGGTVNCWGVTQWLGDGEVGSESCPTPDSEECSAIPRAVSGITDATQITAGGAQSCALLAGGTVDCWGYNVDGELGDGKTLDAAVPVAVSGITHATEIAAGGGDTCALLIGGSVDCWGDNAYGELGDGTNTGPETCNSEVEPCSKTPVAVRAIADATQISVGGRQACALLSGGSIDCWGGNEAGELGNGTTSGPETCYFLACSTTPVAVGGITNSTEIAVGGSHTCALLSDGGIDCWGYGADGDLGDGNTTRDNDLPVPVSGGNP